MWFIPALVTVLAWGTADLFYKKGNDPTDSNSALKTVVMVGVVMGLHAILYMMVYQNIQFEWVNMVLYLPVSAMYILSMAIGYFGLRYIELSISSPISNSSGAVSALMSFFILGSRMAFIQFIAVGFISVGIFFLSYFEKQEMDRELAKSKEHVDKKYRVGAIAIIFPILYCVIDGAGTFLDGYYLETKQIMSEDQALISYELTFLVVGILVFSYLTMKKERMSIKKEKYRTLAALCETLGQFFYVGAIASNAIVVAPMISSYSIVSVILSRIFLKEKLTTKQYLIIGMIMIAIAILGFYDG
ncbi:EamA family transporter [Vagococcus sp. BWB3-3]|uniref:EamA family transporter n=1 Tax=Vagococcus allomyrinae TaxID=2794353 RepID=A0A940P963_9ENTE|nr:GRP family sugar transporter [Vagococcus allomyrinae]MBP1044044.1 EamA family transporter [Vagococcus allomyrinae]